MCVCVYFHALICALVHLSAGVDADAADVPEWPVCVHGPARLLTKARRAQAACGAPKSSSGRSVRTGTTYVNHSVGPNGKVGRGITKSSIFLRRILIPVRRFRKPFSWASKRLKRGSLL